MVGIDKSVRNIGGSRNPYALAELYSEKKIDWATLSPPDMRRTLSAALNTPYENLFSPQKNSPLYRKTLRFDRRGKNEL
jgi:hypothetical protein